MDIWQVEDYWQKAKRSIVENVSSRYFQRYFLVIFSFEISDCLLLL